MHKQALTTRNTDSLLYSFKRSKPIQSVKNYFLPVKSDFCQCRSNQAHPVDVIRTRFFKGQWKYEDANALHIIKIKKTSIMEKKPYYSLEFPQILFS